MLFENNQPPLQGLVLGFDVILDHVVSWAFFSPISDDDTRAPYDLASFTLSIELAQPSPLTKLHVRVDFDEGNLEKRINLKKYIHETEMSPCRAYLVLLTKTLNQLLVHWLVAVFGEYAKKCLAFIKSLGRLMKPAG
jgi:hypothetical protein